MKVGRFIILLSMIGLCFSFSKSRLLSMESPGELNPKLKSKFWGLFQEKEVDSRTAVEPQAGHVDMKFWVPKYNRLEYLAEGRRNGFSKAESDFMLLFARIAADIEKSVTAKKEKKAVARMETGCSAVNTLMKGDMDRQLSFSSTLSKWLDIFQRFCTSKDDQTRVPAKLQEFGFRTERPLFYKMKHKFAILPELKETTYWFGVLEKLLNEEKEASFEEGLDEEIISFEGSPIEDIVDEQYPEDVFPEEDLPDEEFANEEEFLEFIKEHDYVEELPEDFVEETYPAEFVDEEFPEQFVDEGEPEEFIEEEEEILQFIEELEVLESTEDLPDEEFANEEEFLEFIKEHDFVEQLPEDFVEETYPAEFVDEEFPAEEFADEFPIEELPTEEFEDFERDGFDFPKSALEYILENEPTGIATEVLGFCMWEDYGLVKRGFKGFKHQKATKHECHCAQAKCTWTCEEGDCYTCLTKRMYYRAARRNDQRRLDAWEEHCDLLDLASTF